MFEPRMALSAEELRRSAVSMVLDGDAPDAVANLLDVSERSVWRWLRRWRDRGRLGDGGLDIRPGRGRPPKLDARQAMQVLGWIDKSPLGFGFATERWTAPRVAAVIEERMGVRMNHRYLNDWLRRRGITPQIPPHVPRERNEAVIAAWLAHAW